MNREARRHFAAGTTLVMRWAFWGAMTLALSACTATGTQRDLRPSAGWRHASVAPFTNAGMEDAISEGTRNVAAMAAHTFPVTDSDPAQHVYAGIPIVENSE